MMVELERTQIGQKFTQLEEGTHPLPGRYHQDGVAGTSAGTSTIFTGS